MERNKVIAIAGIGYVGLSLAVLLSQHNHVIAVDILEEKVNKINNRISPIHDKEVESFFRTKKLNLIATLDAENAYKQADIVIIAVPTNYDIETNYFDTHNVEDVIELVTKVNPKALIVIKSTIPVGYTKTIKEKYNNQNIIFSPEFLRESKALYDNLYPSRIIIGYDKENEKLRQRAVLFANLLVESALKKNIAVMYMEATEAEAVKLFSNTYLALRVAYFNELDTYAEVKHLNAQDIINGIGLDPRIGNHYNNPSFGYGGYCLPKDTKQLNANFKGIPQNLISAIIKSNATRKSFVANEVYKMAKSFSSNNEIVVGIYRLIMKTDSDNIRTSAILEVMEKLNDKGVNLIIYEPTLDVASFGQYKVINNLDEFKKMSVVIVANRYDHILDDVNYKVYSRDIYQRD